MIGKDGSVLVWDGSVIGKDGSEVFWCGMKV